jgi:hypothetical protein
MGGMQRTFDGKHLILLHANQKKLLFEIGVVSVGRGGQLSVARPPRPRHSEFKGAAGKRADQPG